MFLFLCESGCISEYIEYFTDHLEIYLGALWDCLYFSVIYVDLSERTSVNTNDLM